MVLKTSSVIPDIVIGRLPYYLRALERLQQDNQDVTSSHELGRLLGISSAQIRKDLSHFGGFGKQGTGYQVNFLIDKLQEVLKVKQQWDVAVVGAGNLGSAIANYMGFQDRGFRISHVFDADSEKIGKMEGNHPIHSMDDLKEIIKANHIQVAMLAVPAEHAQEVADQLIEAGVRAILNYAPVNIDVPEHINVQYIDPVVHMQHMTYYIDE